MKLVTLATYGKTKDPDHADCMEALKHELGILNMEMRGHAHIDLARSALAYAALAHGADVVVFIDHDTLFDPLDVPRLAEHAEKTHGIVGAPYSQRRMGGALVSAPAAQPEPVVFFEGGGLYESESIGMGFTAIHRSAFERLHSDPRYDLVDSHDGILRWYFQKLVINGRVCGEDYSFCHSARAAGATLHVDTSIRIKHQGQIAYRIEDCRTPIKDEPTMKIKLWKHG